MCIRDSPLAGALANVDGVRLRRLVQPTDRLFRLEPGDGVGRSLTRRPGAIVAVVHDPGGIGGVVGRGDRYRDPDLRRLRGRRRRAQPANAGQPPGLIITPVPGWEPQKERTAEAVSPSRTPWETEVL